MSATESSRDHLRVPPLSRRRALTVIAAAAGLALPSPVRANSGRQPALLRWRGRALGAETTITLYHPESAVRQRAIIAAVQEIERLEREFSLYRPDSALSRLNRQGHLKRPSLDMIRLLGDATRLGALSGGAFDVSVQPLWRLYADHFSRPEADPAGPPQATIERTRRLVDYRAIVSDRKGVRLARPGMALTLNGIAQGYIADRVAALLADHGIAAVLLDLGEFRAHGRHPEGRPWRVGIRLPEVAEGILRTVELGQNASAPTTLATSSGSGTRFDAAGRFHHLFDPASGRCSDGLAGATVMADTAARADGLSTALAVMAPEEAAKLLRRAGRAWGFLVHADGSSTVIEA